MIGRLRGVFDTYLEDGQALLDVSGVGYVVRMAGRSAALLVPGERAELYIHTAVREDAIELYGFPTKDDLSFFKLLTSVSGIGPKTALSILAAADATSLSRAIAAGNAEMLSKRYGIGKKSAERITVELRDRLAERGAPPAGETASDATDADVLSALGGLGYSPSESRAALKAIPPELTSVEGRVAAALKNIGTRTRTYE